MSVQLVSQEMARGGRRMRRPEHTWHLRTKPFLLQPFMLAPVCAGETLKNFLMQSRVVSDPVVNALIGWHKEYYWFYVKLTDLDALIADTDPPLVEGPGHWVKMLIGDPSFDETLYDQGSDSTALYQQSAGQAYIAHAVRSVVRWYFRDEADMTDTNTVDNMHLVMPDKRGILDSAVLNDNYFHAQSTVDTDLLGDATDAELKVSEIDEALRRYQWARQNGLTDMTYEQYIEQHGVSLPKPKEHKPELLRYVKQWQYPSNTVEPTTGTPTSALSWSFSERGDKDRFFREPGFILGVTTARPKVYFSGQKGHIAQWLDRAEDWLPAALWGDTLASMKKFAQGTGPFSSIADADGYWLDMRDLYLYGDQFVNFALTETNAGLVALPTTALQKKFVADADITALFSTPASKYYVREDGVCQLAIASVQRDYSATT